MQALDTYNSSNSSTTYMDSPKRVGSSSLVSDVDPGEKIVELATKIVVNIGIVYHAEAENKCVRTLCAEEGASVVQYDYFMQDVDPELLDGEVNREIAISDAILPVAQQLVYAAITKPQCSQLSKVMSYAQEMIKQSDAIILPGGESISPKYYRDEFAEDEDRDEYSSDPRRTVLEFFLIYIAQKTRHPVLSICRGHQVLNVYFGGKLDRNIVREVMENRVHTLATQNFSAESALIPIPKLAYFHNRQVVVQAGDRLRNFIKIDPKKGLQEEKEILLDEHEAIKELIGPEDFSNILGSLDDRLYKRTKELESIFTVLEQKTIAIATQSEDGRMLSVQYHPEYLSSRHASLDDIQSNRAVFSWLTHLARVEKMRKCL